MEITAFYSQLKSADTPVFLRAGLRAVPKGRPRFSGNGHAYTPPATREFEDQIRTLAQKVMGHRLPYTCPIRVTVVLIEPPPVSWSAVKKEAALAGYLVPQRGDLDNRVKAVTDAMNGVVYHDDVQIGETLASKKFGHSLLITITVERLGLSDMDLDRWSKMRKEKNG